jgi:hypothetical protein
MFCFLGPISLYDSPSLPPFGGRAGEGCRLMESAQLFRVSFDYTRGSRRRWKEGRHVGVMCRVEDGLG